MASFTGVGDNVTLKVADIGEKIDVAISGTYNMTIALQKEVSAGGGAWETIETWTTANATVAHSVYTTSFNERWRLIVLVDTSGTATATLTNSTKEAVFVQRDRLGNELFTVYQGGALVPKNTPVALDAAVTLTREKHAWRPLTHSAAAGYAVTLPAATGSGDKYTIHVLTTVATTSLTVVPASGDVFNGAVGVSTDSAGVVILAAATNDLVTLNGSTTGGVVGSWIEFTDVASGVWHVGGFLVSTGVEATPFSTP